METEATETTPALEKETTPVLEKEKNKSRNIIFVSLVILILIIVIIVIVVVATTSDETGNAPNVNQDDLDILSTTVIPTMEPTMEPTRSPSLEPTLSPSLQPTQAPGYSSLFYLTPNKHLVDIDITSLIIEIQLMSLLQTMKPS